MRPIVTLAIVFIGLAAGVVGYGAWHSAGHATLYVAVQDTAVPKKFEHLKGAQLAFLDEAGRVLARGKTDEKFGVAWTWHPSAGYCGPDLPQPKYSECFRTHTTWLPTWVRQARYLSITTTRCRIERAPIYFSESRDSMWTWWIPLPHVGGTPYTNFNAYVQVNSETCAAVPHRG